MDLIKHFWKSPAAARPAKPRTSKTPLESTEPTTTVITPLRPIRKKSTTTAGASSKPKTNTSATRNFFQRLDTDQSRAINLRLAYQKPWLDNFETTALELKFKNIKREDETVDFASKAIAGFPGSGLTTTLAARALKAWREGESILILAEHDHDKLKIAQTMLDLASPVEKEKIKADIGLRPSEHKKITITNPGTLIAKASRGSGTRAETTVAEQITEAKPIEALSKDIKHVFIDKVNRYAGDPNKEGRAKLILDILKQTNSTKANPTQIFGVSSTPKVINEDEKAELELAADKANDIAFTRLFPEKTHVIEGESYQELRAIKVARDVELQSLTIETKGIRPNQYGQLFESKHDEKTKTTTIDSSSAIYNLAQNTINGSLGKTRIMTHTARAADDLAKVLTVLGKQSAAVTSYHKGHYQVVAKPDSDTEAAKLEKLVIDGTTHYLQAVTQDENEILHSFETDSSSNVIIDYQILNGHDSPKVDTLIFFNGSTWEPKMLRALGQSACDTNASKPLTVIHCEFQHGNVEEQSIEETLEAILNNKAPWWDLAVSPSPSSTRTTGGLKLEEQPSSGNLNLSNAKHIVEADEKNEAWIKEGLEPIYWLLKPTSNHQYPQEGKDIYLGKLENHFKSRGKTLDIDVLEGKKRDPEQFAKIIDFNQKLLARLFPKHHIYSNPEAYQIHVASIAPSLVELEAKHQGFAEKLTEALYLKDSEDKTKVRNEKWLTRLDGLLGLHDHSNQAVRAQYRSRKLAEVLTKLYGPEFFCFPKNIETAVQVLNGQTVNKFLLTYLAQACNPSADELKNLKTEFPGMFANESSRSFADLQETILSKYPQPPSEADKKEFFTQTLYRDLEIDLPNLIRAAIYLTRDSEQPIRAQDELKSDIQSFLEQAETALFTQEQALVNDGKYLDEITELAKRHLEPLTQEVLFNQLINKIWEDAEVRESESSTDHRKSQMRPDTLATEVIGIKANPKYESIDLLTANKDWLNFITRRTNHIVDLEALSGLQIGTKARLMTAIQDFAKSKVWILTSAQINLLCGIDNPINQNDQNLLREFVTYIGADLNEAVSNFPERLGVRDLSEAALITKAVLEKIDRTGFNSNLAKLTNGATLDPELIAEFLFKENPAYLLHPSNVAFWIECINGKDSWFNIAKGRESRQDILRKYISFLEGKTKSSENTVQLRNIVIALPKLTGILDKDELAAVIQKRSNLASITGRDVRRSDSKTIEYVKKLGESIGLDFNTMSNLAELKDPREFYKEPARLISMKTGPSARLFNQPGTSLFTDEQAEAILTRNLLKATLGAGYSYIDNGGLKEIATIVPTRRDPNITKTLYIYNDKVVFISEDKDSTVDMVSVQTYSSEYRDGSWQEVVQENHTTADEKTLKEVFQKLKMKNPKWSQKLIDHLNRPLAEIINLMVNFGMTEITLHNASPELNQYKLELNQIYNIIFGDETVIKKDSRNTEVFRKWLAYIGMDDLDEVIAEFPKLTGVRSLVELKLSSDLYRSKNKVTFDFTANNSPNRPENILTNRILPNAGIRIDDIKDFADYKLLKARYSEGFKTLLEDHNLENLIEPMFNSSDAGIAEFLVNTQLFSDVNNKFSRDVRVPEANLLFSVLNNIIEYSGFTLNDQNDLVPAYMADARFDSATGAWIHQVYNQAFLALRNLEGKIKENENLRMKFFQVITDSKLIPRTEEKWALRRLINDFFAQEFTFPLNLTDGTYEEVVNAAVAILGGDAVLKSTNHQVKEKGFAILRKFLNFAARTYPGFAEINNDEALREILGIGKVDDNQNANPQRAIDYIRSKPLEHWTSMISSAGAIQNFEEELKQFNVSIDNVLEAFGLADAHFKETLPEGCDVLVSAMIGKFNRSNLQERSQIEHLKILAIINQVFPKNDSGETPFYSYVDKNPSSLEQHLLTTNGVDLVARFDNTKPRLEVKLVKGKWVLQGSETAGAPPVVTVAQIAKTFQDKNLSNRLLNIRSEAQMTEALSSIANEFGMSIKELFKQLDLDFVVNDNGTINSTWMASVLRQINQIVVVSKLLNPTEGANISPSDLIGLLLRKRALAINYNEDPADETVAVSIPIFKRGGKEVLALTVTNNAMQVVNSNTRTTIDKFNYKNI